MIAQSLWKILLVDDDEDDYIITKIMLSEMQGRKAQLVWVSSFEEGRQALANWSYDAVLMDYDLGLGTGLELIREAVANNYPAPLILLTGRGNYEVDVEAMQAGATLYLTKSEVNPLLLERSIRYAIERKRIEQERKQILESIQDGFFAIDKDWQILYINSRAARVAGYEPEELIGRNFWEAFPRLAGTPYEQIYRSAMQERRTVKFEMKGIYQGIWYIINIYPFQEGISIYTQDISERKRAEEALRESEQRFRTIFELAEIGIAIGDIHGRVIQSNAALERMIGYSKEELHGKSFTEFTHPDDVLMELPLLEEMLAGQRDHYEIEKRYLRKDGKEILVRLIRSQVCNEQGEPQLGVALIEDITERKRMDRALRTEKATLAGILNATKESIWLFDRNGIIRMANNTALLRMNLPAEEIIGRHFSQLMNPELAASRQVRLDEAIETKLPVIFEDERAGIIFHHSFYPIFGDHGEVTGVVSFSRDITGQKHTEQILQQRSQELEVSQAQTENAKRRLEAVMAALPVGVAITDASGGNIQANPAFEQVWGGLVRPAQSVEDYTAYQAWWADTGKPVQPEEWASAQAVLKGETVHGQILQIQRFDGRRVFVLNSASPIIDANGAIIGSAVAIQDINRVK